MIAPLTVIIDYIAIVKVDCYRMQGTRACLDTLQLGLAFRLGLSLTLASPFASDLITPLSLSLNTPLSYSLITPVTSSTS